MVKDKMLLKALYIDNSWDKQLKATKVERL